MSRDLDALLRTELEEAQNSYKLLLENSGEYSGALTQLVFDSVRALQGDKLLAFAGNGGSFADAQHMAAEFTGKLSRPRNPMAALVLGANSSSMSAIGNDYGFEHSFARELRAFGSLAGVAIGFTTSGGSSNLIQLGKVAKELGIPVYCFTGASDGGVGEFATLIQVPSARTERIQEMHTTLGHLFCLLVEEELAIF
jgi:D-sedoheptulose 7-phosphate isomerase